MQPEASDGKASIQRRVQAVSLVRDRGLAHLPGQGPARAGPGVVTNPVGIRDHSPQVWTRTMFL